MSAQIRNRARRQGGQIAQSGEQKIESFSVGALPIVNSIVERMNLEGHLKEFLPPDGSRSKLATSKTLMVVVRNLLVSREPLYALGEWSRIYAPDLFGLTRKQLEYLNDDRLGRALDRLFAHFSPELVMAVVRHVVREFQLSLDELHNDSTTVSFFGKYLEAMEEGLRDGQKTAAITFGHSKDHRPDLKQLLYVLTVTEDGGVPIYFSTESGNVVDDRTHRQTWELMRELIGRDDFLYVADCKLATRGNMRYIGRHGGRFISVLPKTRKEDGTFRERLRSNAEAVGWTHLYDVWDDDGKTLVDRLKVCDEETLTEDGHRVWWYHSTRKEQLDDYARMNQVQRAANELKSLQERIAGPRTRLKKKEDVEPCVEKILKETGAGVWLEVDVQQLYTDQPRQKKRGRPGKHTEYIIEKKPRCHLAWRMKLEAVTEAGKTDGVFPLITNTRDMTAEDVLRAYKRQPIIEKRFSQLKTDFEVAPVCLKSIGRIHALLTLYFFALMVQTLLERELRNAMRRDDVESLALYPEGRPCKRPTTRRLIDVFELLQRHILTANDRREILTTELSPLHKQILALLRVPAADYGR